ncbi:D-galactarate dehydratase [Geobacillus sp. BCO2]|nr:D-galactarate dehydratase [Geobacillus sp. BCO2]
MVKQMPLYIKVNDRDNVAIVANAGGLTKGTRFPCGLTLMEDIPQGHKVALADFREGDPIVRYGEVIGYAQKTHSKRRMGQRIVHSSSTSARFAPVAHRDENACRFTTVRRVHLSRLSEC